MNLNSANTRMDFAHNEVVILHSKKSTALRPTTWFIEGDIAQCFDKLSHELIIRKLKEDFHDERFIRLMQELLDADTWKIENFNTENKHYRKEV